MHSSCHSWNNHDLDHLQPVSRLPYHAVRTVILLQEGKERNLINSESLCLSHHHSVNKFFHRCFATESTQLMPLFSKSCPGNCSRKKNSISFTARKAPFLKETSPYCSVLLSSSKLDKQNIFRAVP